MIKDLPGSCDIPLQTPSQSNLSDTLNCLIPLLLNPLPLWKFLKMLNKNSSYDPAIPLLGIHPREQKHVSLQDLHTNVHSSVIIIAKK